MFTDRERKEYERLWSKSFLSRIGCSAPTVFFLLIVFVIVLSSCATKKQIQYVDRDVIKYEYVTIRDTFVNNVYDSVYVESAQKGDTIFLTKVKYKYIYKDKIFYKTDTCYKDSLVTKIEKTTVEKKIIPKWCYFSLVFCGLCLIFAILKLRTWLK